MYEWNEAVQKILDWIEENITENPTLLELSKHVGYSPYYCSTQFHTIVGMTLKSYIAGRKLSHAAVKIRDTNQRILDIAIDYGFSSQEAFTRAFVKAYGCTPYVYRNNPRPILLSPKKSVLFPEYYNDIGELTMSETILTNPNIRMEFIPAHKYIGIWDEKATCYYEFWKTHSCDNVCGIIDSMSNVMHPIITCHTAGWHKEDGKEKYFYGLGVSIDYNGPIPEGFEIKEFPDSYYLVFFHPPFDFLKDCGEVMNRVENLAWNFDPTTKGYKWNEDVCQDYQRHYPEVIGYEVLRPVIKI